MKISAHVNITKPKTYNYPYLECLQSFLPVCDEIIVVNGDPDNTDGSIDDIKKLSDKIKVYDYLWNDKEWDWTNICTHHQFGFEKCTGDWVIKLDIDYVLHENYIQPILNQLEGFLKLKVRPFGVNVRKANILLADTVMHKSQIPFIVNKKDYPKICYGIAYDRPDFMAAIIKEREKNGIFIGESIMNMNEMLRDIDACLLTYDFTFMDYQQVLALRKANYTAYQKYENPCWTIKEEDLEDEVMDKFRKMLLARMDKKNSIIDICDHPIYIQDKVSKLTKDMLGYNMFGWVKKKCHYA